MRSALRTMRRIASLLVALAGLVGPAVAGATPAAKEARLPNLPGVAHGSRCDGWLVISRRTVRRVTLTG
jgi:hypothetical protein